MTKKNMQIGFGILFILISLFGLIKGVSIDLYFGILTGLSMIAIILARDINDKKQKKKLERNLEIMSLLLLSKKVNRIDLKVLSKIRRINTEKYRPEELKNHYIEYLDKISTHNKVKIEDMKELLKGDNKPVISEAADFEILVENELKWIELKSFRNHKTRISNPRLLWECSCKGNIKKNYSRCVIHKEFKTIKDAKIFSSDFSKGLVKIVFDDIKILWVNKSNLWPPSIDSLHIVSDLKKDGFDKSNINSVIDVGSGTGFLGIWIAKKNEHVKHVHFSDWLLLPILTSRANVLLNNIEVRSKYMLGLNTSWVGVKEIKSKYDLLICNPPYLPELGFRKMGKKSTVAGTQLLKSIIKYGRDKAKIVVISFSDIALPEAKEAARYVGVDLEKCIIGTHKVPFRVPIAYKQKGYIEKLLKERGLEENHSSNFRYWHTINTYKLDDDTCS